MRALEISLSRNQTYSGWGPKKETLTINHISANIEIWKLWQLRGVRSG